MHCWNSTEVSVNRTKPCAQLSRRWERGGREWEESEKERRERERKGGEEGEGDIITFAYRYG